MIKLCNNLFLHFLRLVYRQSIGQRNICVFNFCNRPRTLESTKSLKSTKVSCFTVYLMNLLPKNSQGAFITLLNSPQRWLRINDGIKRALTIIISWCVHKKGTRKKSQEKLKSDWAFSFSVSQQEQIIINVKSVKHSIWNLSSECPYFPGQFYHKLISN